MTVKRKKIAVLITGGSIHNHKGLHNACINRAKYLLKHADGYDVDVFFLQEEYRQFKLHNLIWKDNQAKNMILDGVPVKMLWRIEYKADRYYRAILRWYYDKTQGGFLDCGWLSNYTEKFKGYDLLSVHSDNGAIIALNVYKKYGIPYCVTWHGSDIHTRPFTEEGSKKRPGVVEAIEKAEMNFFVSMALKTASDRLTLKGNKTVLYNGVSESFKKYGVERRRELKIINNVENAKVVAFVGNLFPIKNADLLPGIFSGIKQMYSDDVCFWIIGDGGLRTQVEQKLNQFGVDCKMCGNQPTEKMVDLYNCMDVLVLPSKNEGLPLVTVEALACGANVVGSNVGGIPEVVGKDFCVDLGDDFVKNLAQKVVNILKNPTKQLLSEQFHWDKIARDENEIYKDVLNVK